MTRAPFLLLIVGLLLALPAVAATSDVAACDETVRANFAADVAAGATEADLEAKYGECRKNLTSQATAAAQLAPKSISITNNGSIYYERMNGCGYHPQGEMLACDVEIRQPFGFGGAAGSNEHVLFCVDCDNDLAWDYATLGTVHVTDDFSGGTPSWYFNVYATTWGAPTWDPNTPGQLVNCTANDGAAMKVKAMLSWVLRPDPVTLTSCYTFAPFWGNTITFDARRDP